MSVLDVNWGPCGIAWPSYQQYLTNNEESGSPPKAWQGITSVTFRHTAFIGSGGVYIFNTSDLQTISFPNLTTIQSVQPGANPASYLQPLMEIISNDALTSVDFPVLNALGGHSDTYMTITSNAALTTIDMPVFAITAITNCTLDFRFNALSQTVIDNILARCDASPTPTNVKILRLQGGTNATPSAAGLVSKASLVGKGWTVTNN